MTLLMSHPQKSLQKNADEVPLTEQQLEAIPRQGELIVDATACPQDISYPTVFHLASCTVLS